MKKGISLIVLIVTIIVMIIIAGAVIISLSNSNIIDQADKAKTKWDIASIKEQLTIYNALAKTGTNTEIKNGTLKDIGIDDESWNEKVIIQDGKLVFLPENLTDSEEEALQNAGLERSEHISVVNASTKASKYANDDSVVTPETLYDKLVADNDARVYILEDLDGWNSDFGNNGFVFYGVLDGLGHTVKNIEQSIVASNEGKILNLTVTGEITEIIDYFGSIASTNRGIIENCHSEVDIYESYWVGGIASENQKNGVIYRCSNKGDILGAIQISGGIVGHNSGKIKSCYNTGKIGDFDENNQPTDNIDAQMLGGIAGGTYIGSATGGPEISDCYNLGDIAGYVDIGGITGWVTTTGASDGNGVTTWVDGTAIIKNNYNIGNVYGQTRHASITYIAKEKSDFKFINCFAKNDTADELILNSERGVLTNVDWINNLVNDGDAETEKDRDKLLEMLNAGNTEEVWVKDTNNINNGYPILKWQLSK